MTCWGNISFGYYSHVSNSTWKNDRMRHYNFSSGMRQLPIIWKFQQTGKEDKIRYQEKIIYQILMDFQIIGKTMLLLDIWYIIGRHITIYLINYESLVCQSHFVCSHVQDVFCHSLSKESEFCCVKANYWNQ